MKKALIMALLFAFNLSLMAQDKEPFWLGADISGTTELEAQGVQLRNSKGRYARILP